MEKTINNRQELLAYCFAALACLRQLPSVRRATIICWAEANKLRLSDEDINYIFEHWTDYIEPL